MTDIASVERFDAFDLDPRIVAAVTALGFESPTPIQAEAIPVLRDGHDIIGRARTGSGKTAAFGLPLLERVKEGGRGVRALLLAPTRELAVQVAAALRSYADRLPLRIFCIYGGTPYDAQLRALRDGVDVVVGTPGRLLDLMKRGSLDLSNVEVLVLDEADEMLRLGFLDDVDAIIGATPDTRQVALFSATLPSAIRRVAGKHLHDPVEVQVEANALTTSHIEQRWMRVPRSYRMDALQRVLAFEERQTALVFARTRAECAEIADRLAAQGVAVDALHGDLNQPARERVLRRLRARRLDLLIATDVAARGIDVEHITHVINLELPKDAEQYVHRIGRTGRAGRKGIAISFVTPKFKHRIRSLGQAVGAEIHEMQVPTDNAIAGSRRKRLETAITDLEPDDLAPAAAWLEGVLESTELPIKQLAIAAVHLLAKERRIILANPDEPAIPDWVRPSKNEVRVQRDTVRSNEVEVFLPIGRVNGVRPGDLVGAIANEAGIPGHEIGRVTIHDRKSFIGLPRELAASLVDGHAILQIRGIDVPLTIARPSRPPQPHDGPRGRGPRPFRGPPRAGGDGKGRPPRRDKQYKRR